MYIFVKSIQQVSIQVMLHGSIFKTILLHKNRYVYHDNHAICCNNVVRNWNLFN